MTRTPPWRAELVSPPPPHPLPAEHCKGQSKKGVGDGFRPATVLSQIVGCVVLVFFPSRRGKCCPSFSLCVFRVWFGVSCRFFCRFLFLGSLFEKIFGSELLFLGLGVGFVFFGGFLPMFLLHFWRFAPESVQKNSLDVRSGVFGVVLFSFGFFSLMSFLAVF